MRLHKRLDKIEELLFEDPNDQPRNFMLERMLAQGYKPEMRHMTLEDTDAETLRGFRQIVALHDGDTATYLALKPKQPRRVRELWPKPRPSDTDPAEIAKQAEFVKYMNDVCFGRDERSIRDKQALENVRVRLARGAQAGVGVGGMLKNTASPSPASQPALTPPSPTRVQSR